MTAQHIVIDAGAMGLAFAPDDDGLLRQVAFGASEVVAEPPALPLVLYPLAYPTAGEEVLREPALRITHADGSVSTRLIIESAHQVPHQHGVEHRIVLTDRVAPVAVTLCFRTWPDHEVLQQWVEVANGGSDPIVVHQAASAAIAFGAMDPHLTHWAGGWAAEWHETTEALALGTKSVSSAGGVRPALHLPPVVYLAPDGRATETEGEVLVATMAWGGDTRFDAEVAMHRQGRLLCGTQHRGADRHLDPDETYVTPAAVLVRSTEGKGPASRALHGWARTQVVRDGDRPRAIAFNNWEAMGFNLTTESVNEVVDGAAAVGAELFLLDDGWFGTSHPRDGDHQGLGDWDTDLAKFRDGLGPVVAHTLERGMRFGLWVEPEMVNPRSELYEAHPDWVIAEPERDRREERQQLVLDLCLPEVADFVVETVDRILAAHPDISFLKWDANRDVFEAGSRSLVADRQSHLPIDRVQATREVMARVAQRHPDVELMLCASGGGRSDLDTLQWFHELWTSDNTDPVDRVRIQWGASHLLPALVLGAHVTRWGQKPVALSCAVAMSARFGFDLDPRGLSDEERAVAVDATEQYRRIRSLVQFGSLHRLVSPIDTSRAALAYLQDRTSADGVASIVVFGFLLDGADVSADGSGPIEVPGLEPGTPYRVENITPGGTRTNEIRAGNDLVENGVAWPEAEGPAAVIWLITPADEG